jgi:hypothetical protein
MPKRCTLINVINKCCTLSIFLFLYGFLVLLRQGLHVVGRLGLPPRCRELGFLPREFGSFHKVYRRGATSGVLMKCVPREEGKDILEEIQKGVCGNHASSLRWSARPSDELSTSPQLWAMLRNSSEGAKGDSTSPSNNTS